MAAFQPSQEQTETILRLLKEGRSPNQEANARIQRQLDEHNHKDEFNLYLAHILCNLKQEGEETRCVAGLLLKNNLQNFFEKLSGSLRLIQQSLLQNLLDPSHAIRNITSICIATCTRCGDLKCWLQNEINLIQCLVQLLDSGNQAAIDGSLSTLVKVCEDSCHQLDLEIYGSPVNILVPKLIQFFGHPDTQSRKNALHSIVNLMQSYPTCPDGGAGIFNCIISNHQQLIQGLIHLATDTNKDIRKHVCRCFVCLLDAYQILKPGIKDVMNYMLQQTQDPDESLALEACEFWSAIADIEVAAQDLHPFIPQLLPVLLKGMVYSELDRSMLNADDDDSHIADKEEHIHPHIINKAAKAKVHAQHKTDDDDGDDDDAEVSEWNLRKCSASSLDVLSNSVGDSLLACLLPLIQDRMQESKPWEVRESAILALGAIAEGCYTGMQPHLNVLVPYLLTILHNERKPLVRSITCWTLSRYARWIVSQSPPQFFEPFLHVLLIRVLDNNKRVQEAACSAFATLEEEAQSDLIPYLPQIIQCLVQAFDKYQAKNLFILYDAVVTLCDAVHSKLNQPEFVQMLMVPLLKKWQTTRDDDRSLFPLLSCLTSLAQAVGPGFMPYTEGIFQRCVSLIQRHFEMKMMAMQNPSVEAPDREFVVCSLDLLSGLADGLGSAIEPLIVNSTLLPLLGECMKMNDASDVRQSAFAFVGDLAKMCMPHLKNCLPQFMPVLIDNLKPQPVTVCNNAAWSIGEIAVKIEREIEPWVPAIMDRLIPILCQCQNRNLLENTGITLGRLGLVCPNLVAPRLQEFIHPWCFHLRNIRNDVEKEHAFLGMCQMIRLNPNAALNSFAFVCDAFASWGNPKKSLKDEFLAILTGFRQHFGAQWPAYFDQFPALLKNNLREVYNLQ